jgi:hypothetical protein
MKKQITHISVHQSSKTIGLIYLALLVVCVPIGLGVLIFDKNHGEGLIIIFLPFFYAIMGYVLSVIGFFIYNQVAKRFGGFEFTVREINSPDTPE